jgi:hypothetical protein
MKRGDKEVSTTTSLGKEIRKQGFGSYEVRKQDDKQEVEE